MSEHLVALTPAQVPAVQADLAEWCRNKCVELGKDLARARQSLSIVTAAGWQKTAFVREISKVRSRMIYFAKIREAVQHGYLVVPNFPVEVMAIRLDPERQRFQQSDYDNIDVTDQGAKGQMLAPHEGQYVANRRPARDSSYTVTNKDGSTRLESLYTASGYEDPDFPIKLIRPEVLDATRQAMALKLFDRIGVVTGRDADPLVVGQIIDPRSTKWNVRVVSFFVAWWLDPGTL